MESDSSFLTVLIFKFQRGNLISPLDSIPQAFDWQSQGGVHDLISLMQPVRKRSGSCLLQHCRSSLVRHSCYHFVPQSCLCESFAVHYLTEGQVATFILALKQEQLELIYHLKGNFREVAS
jgi:hypothetical protein